MAKDRLPDKLAVILHADVAGSTQLVQQDEHLAHERIQDSFRRFGDTIAKYRGAILELRGDALLAEFERASDAVSATLAFQADQAYYLSRLKDDLKPDIRVGIAMGEVVIADSTITGAGVVLAQRVEQLADPGGVCITAALHEALPKRMPFDLENLGEQELKGFEDPVRVYRVELSAGGSVPLAQQASKNKMPSSRPGLVVVAIVIALVVAGGAAYWFKTQEPKVEAASIESMAYPLPDKPSIAVLPFTNMSGDPEQEYFADGMTEDLITDISKLSGLFVIARNSVSTYKGKAVKVRQVAEELGVRYVMEGSVRRVGNQARINAQLIDATTGGHVWAERYDRELEDIFAIQDEITGKIVQALEVRLTTREISAVSSRATNNFDAYELFLKGQQNLMSPDRHGLTEAINIYRRALDLDPGFSRAYGAIAVAMVRQYQRGYTDIPVESLNRALEIAQQAVASGPDIPQVYWALGFTHLHRKEYEHAITATQQAIEIAPNYADAYALLSFIYNHQGNYVDAIPSIHRAMQLNPFFTWEYLYNLGFSHYLAGEYRQAIDRLVEALEKNALAGTPRVFLIASHVRSGDLDEARWEAEQLQLYNPEINLSLIRHTWAQSDEIKNALIADLRKAGFSE